MNEHNPPFLLLRGLVREQRHWGDFIAILQQHFPQTDMITLDIPGNGRLYQQTSPRSIAGMTDALRAQLSSLAVQTPFNLIGISMGGMIAIDWMLRYPNEIASGVLINTSISNYAPFYQRLRWQNYASFFKMVWQAPAQREQTGLALTANLQGNNAQVLENWQRWQQECPVSLKSACNQLLASATFKAHQKPVQPLLILTATADRLVDCQCSIKLHEVWQTDFAQHSRAGHDLPLDDPWWVSEMIKVWLERRHTVSSITGIQG